MHNQVLHGISEQIVHNGITISCEGGIIESVCDNNDKISEIKEYELQKKNFSSRESVLTVVFENQQMKSIRHFFLILLFSLAYATVARDLVEENNYTWYDRLRHGCGNFHIALTSWLMYYCLTCCTYLCFKIWAFIRTQIVSTKFKFERLLDILAILIVLGYYIFSFQMAAYIVRTYNIQPAPALTLLVEQTKMLMKVHSFIRSNVPKVLEYDVESDKKLVLPSFGYFVFFTFVPTLIYKDKYPRTRTIRWRRVAVHIIEIFVLIASLTFVTHSLLVSKYRDFGIRKYTYAIIFMKIAEISFPSMLFFILAFYLVLHEVQNLFAEILRFADRLFYRDWWNATDLTTFFKKWNLIVYDWLFIYVYEDSYKIFSSKIFSKFLTFFISALVHEWIVTFSLGFFFPVMFCLFFILGTILSFKQFPQHSLSNISLLICVSSGITLIISCYTLELIARNNNFPSIIKQLDFYIPRSLTCDCYV